LDHTVYPQDKIFETGYIGFSVTRKPRRKIAPTIVAVFLEGAYIVFRLNTKMGEIWVFARYLFFRHL